MSFFGTLHFVDVGFRTLTRLFTPNSEPHHPLRVIQAQAEENNAVFDVNPELRGAVIRNLNTLVPDTTGDATNEAAQNKTFLNNNDVINDYVAQHKKEEPYEKEQTKIFTQKLDEFIAKMEEKKKNEDHYKTKCKDGIKVELKDMLMDCFITRKEGLSDEFYTRIREMFEKDCSQFATESFGRVTDSWLPDISISGGVGNETFFKRTALYLDALKAYNIFNTPRWRDYKLFEDKRISGLKTLVPSQDFWNMQYEREWNEEWAKQTPPPQPSLPPLPAPFALNPPGGPASPGYGFRTHIHPYNYVVGPIVDFEKLEGRTLIYVKCYDDNTLTTGIYFWVYLSQSEGLFRVYFKLRANSIIEKGFDYTQGTLVDFRLQSILSSYYTKHYSRGKRAPIKLDSLQRVLYFVENMPYLQSSFLDNFPLPSIICPDNTVRSYVGLPMQPYTRDALGRVHYTRDALDRVQGLVGHYYLIDKKYNAIFYQGFPLIEYEIFNFFPPTFGNDVNPDNRYCRYLIENQHVMQTLTYTNIFKDFLKGPVGGQTFTISEPLMCCFMTSCPKTTLVSLDDLLNVMNYTATFWVQGLQNFTKMFNGMLSPVLYIIIGAMVERPDFELSSVRSQMLGIKLDTGDVLDYKKNSAALMTLGTQDFAPGDPTLYLPSFPPSRESAVASKLASKKQPVDFMSEEKFKIEVKAQIELVEDNVNKILPNVISTFRSFIPTVTKDESDIIKKQLIDFALLAIKADWLKRKFDDSYEAVSSVFPDEANETIQVPGELPGELPGGTTIKKMKLYCLCKDDTFLELEDLNCLDPNTEFLKILPSKFNETRPDYDVDHNNAVNVVVDTLAQQYCMKFSYLKKASREKVKDVEEVKDVEDVKDVKDVEEVKEMYVVIQLSSTIVYTVVSPNKILYAIDMQKTPTACLPQYRLNETPIETASNYMRIIRDQAGGAKGNDSGEPGAKKGAKNLSQPLKSTGDKARKQAEEAAKLRQQAAAEPRKQAAAEAEHERQTAFVDENKKILLNLEAVLSTDRTIFSTAKRVASWGGFFAGKMMEYLFGRYFQLPTLFKLFAPQLQVCHAYYTTALIYNYNTSRPCVFFNVEPPGKSYSFATLFARKLSTEGFIAPPAAPAAPGDPPQDTQTYVSRRLQEHTAAIKLIGQNVTAPFLNYTSVDDRSSVGSSTSPSTSPSPSPSTPSAKSRAQKAQEAREEEFYTQLRRGDSLPSSDSAPSYDPSSQDSSQDSSPNLLQNRVRSRSSSREPNPLYKNPPNIVYRNGGGSLITNKSTNRCKTKRKNRKTTRKNGKVNRMVKKHTTKYKTYKRKANGRKLKGNNRKNNKTTRRYRRVRK